MDGVRGGHEARDNARNVEEKHRELDATYAVKGRISSPSAACLSGIPGPPGFCLAQMQIRREALPPDAGHQESRESGGGPAY